MSVTTPRSRDDGGSRPLWRDSATLAGGRQIRRTTWRCAWVALLCGALVASFALVASGAQAAPLTDCVSSGDNGDPVMTGVTISPPLVDVVTRPRR